MLKLFAYI